MDALSPSHMSSTATSPASMNAGIRRNPKDSTSTTRTRIRQLNTTNGGTMTAVGGGSSSSSSPHASGYNKRSPQRTAAANTPIIPLKSPTHKSSPVTFSAAAPPPEDSMTPSSYLLLNKNNNNNHCSKSSSSSQQQQQIVFQAFFDDSRDIIPQEHMEETTSMMQSTFPSLPLWGEKKEKGEDESRLLVHPIHESSDTDAAAAAAAAAGMITQQKQMIRRRQTSSPSVDNVNSITTTTTATTTTMGQQHQVLKSASSFASEIKSVKSHTSIPSDTPYYNHPQDPNNNHPHASSSQQQQQQQPIMFSYHTTLDSQEQALFEQRLTHDPYGIAVRKINSNGKSQLRYVKCETILHNNNNNNNNSSSSTKKNSSKMGHLNMSKSLPVTLNSSFSSSHHHNHNNGVPLAGGSTSSITKNIPSTDNNHNGSSLNCLATMVPRNASFSNVPSDHHPIPMTAVTVDHNIPTTSGTTSHTTQDNNHHNNNNTLHPSNLNNRSRADSTTSSVTTSAGGSHNIVGGSSGGGIITNQPRLKKSLDESFDTHNNKYDNTHHSIRVLAWGNKKKIKIPLTKFISVHKGKTTDRTKKNTCPPCRLLSLISTDPILCSLDIEAPTQLDRDKFAVAFSQFLRVPLVEEEEVEVITSTIMTHKNGEQPTGGVESTTLSIQSVVSAPIVNERKLVPILPSMGYSVPDAGVIKKDSRVKSQNLTVQVGEKATSISLSAVLKTDVKGENPTVAENIKRFDGSHKIDDNQITDYSSPRVDKGKGGVILDWKSSDIKSSNNKMKQEHDMASQVSSLTQVIDEEIIEELHQTITELRAELEASRAEAARAVKVAEQAIQSAESCSSNDWNSTVTHKAAEAAAQAQKRSAEAMARQRKAEENLAEERKNAAYWRKQADIAEGEVNKLRIRVAAAEVQRFNVSATLQDVQCNTGLMVELVKRDAEKSEEITKGKLQASEDKNRALEALVEKSKRIVKRKDDEIKKLQVALTDAKSTGKLNIFNRGGAKKTNDVSHDSTFRAIGDEAMRHDSAVTNYSNIQSEIIALRCQLRSIRRETLDDFKQLPNMTDDYLHEVGNYMKKNLTELALVKEKLALEASCRRKLLHELQDLRGNIRTYCRPILKSGNVSSSILSSPADDICVLNGKFLSSEPNESAHTNPMRFEFDKVFPLGSSQNEIFCELEGTIIDVLNGYNICMISYGSAGAGKTFTIMGDIEYSDTSSFTEVRLSNAGVAFLAVQQLFEVAQHRSDSFHDSFTLSMIEVHNEKLVDMIGPVSPTADGSSKFAPQKLEIKTNHDGDTIIEGALHIPLSSHCDFTKIWTIAMSSRVKRLQDEGIDRHAYEASCHTIVTVHVISANMTNGTGTTGKIHFVDLAASDAVIRRNSIPTKPRTNKSLDILAPVGNNQDWKFMNKSISVLVDVAISRAQFSRSVPYRNSTITHLLRDSLEADTKVILLVCVGCDAENLQDTANALRFASVMRNVVVGKATKHLLT